jgi:hypothetical protein
VPVFSSGFFRKFGPIATGVLLLVGCAAQRELTPFQPVSSENAIIRWQRGNVSLTCDAVCARSASGGAFIRLYKQSPSPLLELRLEPNGTISAQGPLTDRSWAGVYGNAPAPLATWISFLITYQHARALPDGEKEIHTAAASIAYKKNDSGLKTLSIRNADTAETISGIFR